MFTEIYSSLTTEPLPTHIKVKGEPKTIKGMAEFRTINMGVDGYLKIMFTDGSFLLAVPSEQSFYYADKLLHTAAGISDEMIGRDQTITYSGKEYHLANKDDFQYTVKLYIGGPDDIEGECKFSDYVPDSEDELLSLGWLTRTGERADINPHKIEVSDVQL